MHLRQVASGKPWALIMLYYMSVTGVIEYSDDVDSFIGHKTLIKTSSWGFEIYIDWEEYCQNAS